MADTTTATTTTATTAKSQPGPLDKLLDAHPIAHVILGELLINKVLPWAVKLYHAQMDQRVQDHEDKVKQLVCFALAMNFLVQKGPGNEPDDQYVHDVISDFMGHPDGLNNNDTDMEDFAVKVAKVGPHLDDTVQALRRLAHHFPSHAARKAEANKMGWIGAQAVDLIEHGQNAAKATWKGITKGAKAVGKGAKVVADTAVDAHDTVKQTLDDMETHISADQAANNDPGVEFQKRMEAKLKSLTK